MIRNRNLEGKFNEILVSLKAGQYLRAEEITKNALQRCEVLEKRRGDDVLEHNYQAAKKMIREFKYQVEENGNTDDTLRRFLSNKKNFSDFI